MKTKLNEKTAEVIAKALGMKVKRLSDKEYKWNNGKGSTLAQLVLVDDKTGAKASLSIYLKEEDKR